jgi:protein SCO1
VNTFIFTSVLLAALASPLGANDKVPGKLANEMPEELKGIGITEKLGNKIDRGLVFKNEAGQDVALGNYFQGNKPVLLSMVYYGCPNLCNFYLNGLFETLKKMNSQPGRDFEMVMVSIDPSEKPELAVEKKENYRK